MLVDNVYIPKLRFKNFSEKVSLKTLDDVFDLRNGYTPSKSNILFWNDGTISWFRIDDIRLNGQILNSSLVKVTKLGIKNKLFKSNSIILSTTATIGVHALITTDFICNQQFTVFEIKNEYQNIINPIFSFYYFFRVANWCKRNIKSSSFPSIECKYLKKHTFPNVSLNEQNRIAFFFTLLDQQISLVKNKLKSIEHFFNFFLNYFFSKKNKKQFGHEKINMFTLNQIAKITKGDQVNKSNLKSAGKYYYQNGGIEPSGWIDKFNRNPGTISINEGGNCGFVKWHNDPFWSGGHLYTLEITSKIHLHKYLYFNLKANEKQISKLKTGTSISNIQKNELEKFKIYCITNINVQQKIVNLLVEIDNVKNLIRKKIYLLKDKKKFYLKNLFSFIKTNF